MKQRVPTGKAYRHTYVGRRENESERNESLKGLQGDVSHILRPHIPKEGTFIISERAKFSPIYNLFIKKRV